MYPSSALVTKISGSSLTQEGKACIVSHRIISLWLKSTTEQSVMLTHVLLSISSTGLPDTKYGLAQCCYGWEGCY